MRPPRSSIARACLLAFGLLILTQAPASAQFGYGGFGGFGGGFGGFGGGFGGFGNAGFGFGGVGYGYGGFGAVAAYPNYGPGLGGVPLLGYTGYGNYALFGPPYAAQSNAFGLGGVGYPGISAKNPYFSFGLSPLAAENAIFERTVLGRGLPPTRSAPANQGMARPQLYAPVGTGTFSPPQ